MLRGIIFLSSLTLGCLIWAQDEFVATGWTVHTIGTGIKPALDIDANGRIHISGMTEELEGEIWYAVNDVVSNPWKPRTIARGYYYGPGDLLVDHAGIAHVAAHDHDAENAVHIAVSADQTSSIRVADTPFSHDGWDTALALDRQGKLHMSNVDPSGFGAENSLQMASFDGLQWTTETVPESGSFMYGFNTSIAFDQLNQSHILYTQAQDWTTQGSLQHAYEIDDEWFVETVVTDGIKGRFPSLVFDKANRGHAVWVDIDQDDVSHGEVQYGRLENGEWEFSKIGNLNEILLGFSGARKLVSIDLDVNDNPVVGYGDLNSIRVAKQREGRWNSEVVFEADGFQHNGMTVLRVDPTSNGIAIAFWQPTELENSVRLLSFENTQLGDFNFDGLLEATDIALLATTIVLEPNNLDFDLTGDGTVDTNDLRVWVKDLKQTYFGDANFDGEFSSFDFVQVFQNGEYEDQLERNSTWTEGDWNGDLEFSSTDFVFAFQDGGYELGPLANTAAVPEPENSWGIWMAWCITGLLLRHTRLVEPRSIVGR